MSQLAALVAIAFLFGACRLYRADPLPSPSALRLPPAPRSRLKVRASHFRHLALRPMTIDLTDGLSPDEAAILAVLENPSLRAARDAHGEASAQIISAGLLPNPVLSVAVDQPVGSGASGTVTAYSLGLEMDIGRLFGRGATRDASRSHLREIDLGIAWKEWQVAQAARLATVRLALVARRRALVDHEIALTARTVSALQTAVGRGDANLRDLGIHRAALESLRQVAGDLLRAERRQTSRLRLLIGFPPQSPLRATWSPAAANAWPPLPEGSELIKQAARTRLDLQALRQGYRTQEERLRGAALAQLPAITIGLTHQRNESAVNFVGGLVTLGLPLFDRAQGQVALATASRSRLRHELLARMAQMRARIAELLTEDKLLDKQLGVAQRGIVALTRVERAEAQGVKSGDIDRMAWQEVRRTLLEMRLKLAALVQARMELRVALVVAVGGPVTAPPLGPRHFNITPQRHITHETPQKNKPKAKVSP